MFSTNFVNCVIMKNIALLFSLLLLISQGYSQNEFKSFSEESYSVGDEIILSTQMFQHGATKLMPEHYKDVLKVADFLEEHRKFWIEIYCYTNETLEGLSVEDLCKKRANAISQRLILTHNIAPKRLTVKGYYSFAGLAGGVGSQIMVIKLIKT